MTRTIGTQRPSVRGVALSAAGLPVRHAPIAVVDARSGVAPTLYGDADFQTVLSSLLADSNGVYEFWAPDGTYDLSASGSDRMQEIESVKIVSGLSEAEILSVVDYGAKGDGRLVTDGAMTSGLASLVCATSAPFAAIDVGKVISVEGAGVAGAMLRTTIASFQSASEVTLTDAASTTTSAADVVFGTDDSSAFTTAIALIASLGGGVLDVSRPARDGFIVTSGFVLPSNTVIEGAGPESRIFNFATEPTTGRNVLFLLGNVSNIAIRNLRIDAGQDQQYSAVQIGLAAGSATSDVLLENLDLRDHKNFAVAVQNYAGVSYNRVAVKHVSITGVANPSTSGGMNFFPTGQTVTGAPAWSANIPMSRNLTLEDVYIDVSNGSSTVGNHSNNCIKISNTRNILINGLTTRGGQVGGVVFEDGCFNVQASNIHAQLTAIGLSANTNLGAGLSATRSTGVVVKGYTYDAEDITGTPVAAAIGQVVGFRLSDFYVNRDIQYKHEGYDDSYARLSFHHGTLVGANIVGLPPGSLQKELTGLQIDHIRAQGNGVAQKGRVLLNVTNYPVKGALVDHITCSSHDGNAVEINGSDNQVHHVTSIDGNPNNTASIAAVYDVGLRTQVGKITITTSPSGTHHVKYHYRRNVDGKFALNGPLVGTPETTGVNILNQTSVCSGDYVVSTAVVSFAASSGPTYIWRAPEDCYVLAIGIAYTTATTNDVNQSTVRVGKFSGSASSFHALITAQNKAIGSTEWFVNDGGAGEITTRALDAGDLLSWKVDFTAGATGAGIITVVLVKALK